MGRESGPEGFEEYLTTKSDSAPGLRCPSIGPTAVVMSTRSGG